MGMNRTLKNILTLVICLVVLAGIGVGIYFIYRATEKPADPEPVAIVVTYNANGGEVGTETASVYTNSAYGTLPTATREGYTFDGWFTAATDGTKVEATTVVTATEDHTLYACWTLNTYNVVLNENNGNSVNDLTYTVNTETLTLPTPTRDGYTFDGWFTALTGGTKVAATDILAKLENQEYFARWTANEFTVIFNSNKPASAGEVAGTMENQTFTFDVEENLNANAFELEYYNFAGWATTVDGEIVYTDAQSVKNLALSGDVTLYAIWTADNERVITFNGNGVAVSPATKVVEVGQSYGELPVPTREGYTFSGWYTELTGGTKVETTTIVPSGANHTLFAQWTINTYNVILNENGGSDVNNLTFTIDTTILTLPSPTKANYVFAGWFTALTGGTKVVASDILAKLENQEYFAQWTAEEYDVLLDENGGNSLNDLTYTIESSDITLPIPTRDGYTFIGWFGVNVVNNTTYYVGMDFFATGDNSLAYTSLDNTNLNDANKVVGIDCDVFAVNIGSGTLIAKWEEIVVPPATVEITFNANGGTVDPTTATLTVGQNYGTLPTPTKANYVFAGWFTALTGGTKIETTTVIENNVNHTLYAHWTAVEYNVILDENGGDALTDLIYTIESSDITLPTPTRDGYTFIGWFGVKVVGGTTYYVGTDFFTTGDNSLAHTSLDHVDLNETNKVTTIDCDFFAANVGSGTLIAKWEEIVVPPVTVEVTFNANGGTVNPTTATLIVNNAYGDLPIPTLNNYSFDGWYTAVTGGDLINSTSIVENAENHTLYAHWTLNAGTEDLSVNTLQTNAGYEVDQITDGATYKIVDPVSGNGYMVVFTTTQSASIVNLSGTNVDIDEFTGTATITGWAGSPVNLVIPEKIVVDGKTYVVTAIADKAFYQCSTLKTVVIGNEVLTIGESAIYGCDQLTTITIGNKVETIGKSAFKSNWAITEIIIPDSVITIGQSAFSDCRYVTSVVIGKRVQTIGESAFNTCMRLTNITIPKNVTTIEGSAFLGCSELESVEISKGVTSLGINIFKNCTSLTSIIIPGTVSAVPEGAFTLCGKLESVTIENGVTAINNNAFFECYALTTLAIPASLTSIGDLAFYKCNNLDSFIVSGEGQYTALDNGNVLLDGKEIVAFAPYGITEYTIPSGAESIAKGVFGGTKLTKVVIPGTIKTIGVSAFESCYSLVDLTISEGVEKIEATAFNYCSALISLTIPNSVTSIGGTVFAHCSKLENVIIGEGVKEISSHAFYSCPALKTINIPDQVEAIRTYAFACCENLKTITIGSGLEKVDDEAFDDVQLSTVIINSADVASGISTKYSFSYLVYYASEIYIKSELAVGEYMSEENFETIIEEVVLEPGSEVTYTKYADRKE